MKNKEWNQTGNYAWKIDRTDPNPINPENEVVEVDLIDNKGNEYYARFTTILYIQDIFDKNKRTGECAQGTYFRMNGMIIVQEITEPIIRRTIESLEKNLEIEVAFQKRD